MNLTDIKTMTALLAAPQKIAIIPHKNPDGDAIGSTLALWHYLKLKGQEATIVAPNDYPQFLKWMPGNEHILNFERENSQAKQCLAEATIIFTLDFNSFGRTGQMADYLAQANADFVMIDHHQQPDDYAKITYSDVSMSSTCEMVYNFIEYLNDTQLINKDIATCIYTGIMTDTGSFKFPATTSRTHKIVAELIDKGAPKTEIHQRIYDTNNQSRLKLLGIALNNMVILQDYGTAFITLSQAELDACNYQKGDTEGFVNYGLTLDGIKFAVIFIENSEEKILKISFRSIGDFSVNEFAREHFNGGGHDNAAGGRSEEDIPTTVARFKKLLENYKAALSA